MYISHTENGRQGFSLALGARIGVYWETHMDGIKKSAKTALARGRETAKRVGKVAGSAAVVAAKAGASAALVAGTVEAVKGWKESSPPDSPKSSRKMLAAVMAGTATLTVAGLAIARARRKG
jgi:hypothetical protein